MNPFLEKLYETTATEYDVQKLLGEGFDSFSVSVNEEGDYVFTTTYKDDETPMISIDQDGQINKLSCTCSAFNRGPRNISAPCKHILALYTSSGKFTRLKLEVGKEYKLNDIMELCL